MHTREETLLWEPRRLQTNQLIGSVPGKTRDKNAQPNHKRIPGMTGFRPDDSHPARGGNPLGLEDLKPAKQCGTVDNEILRIP
jgi:hypothetical protein